MERLIDAVRAMQAASANVILEHVLKSADVFVAGAPPCDDMALSVARVP
jgi:hypothetical protein